jgi:hypothetical protein
MLVRVPIISKHSTNTRLETLVKLNNVTNVLISSQMCGLSMRVQVLNQGQKQVTKTRTYLIPRIAEDPKVVLSMN